MTGIDYGDHCIEHIVSANFFVNKEGLGDRAGIGQASRFDDNAVEIELAVIFLLYQFTECHDQVATHGAADAAIVHLNDLFIAVLHQDFIVDVFLAELIFDHGNFVAMPLMQNTINQGGFSCT